MPSGTPYRNDESAWLLYIVECRDGSLYTGITNDIDRRIRQHNEGEAARYTRSHRPVVLRYQEPCGTRSQALIRECAVKLMSPRRKRALFEAGAKTL